MARITLPDQQYLNECLSYDSETGILTWKVRPPHHFTDSRAMNGWNTQYSQKIAGTNIHGYICIKINRRAYKAHRLIWKMVTGNTPSVDIDHKDCNPTNNVWTNLREATHNENMYNKKTTSKNQSGYRGVSFHKPTGKYQAQINVNRTKKYLGVYDKPEQAHQAYLAAQLQFHQQFANRD